VAPESARLDGLRLAALEDRIDADLELGRHADLVAELSALAARYPLQERLRAQLMLALYRSGRQAEALDVYRETRRMLADELGLEPSPALRDLERAILEHDQALDAPAKAARRTTTPAIPTPAPRRRRRAPRLALAALALLALGAAGATAAVLLSRSPAVVSAAETTSTPATTARPATTRRTTTRPAATRRTTTATTRAVTRPKTTAPVTTAAPPAESVPVVTAPAVSTHRVTTTRPTTTRPTTTTHSTTSARTTTAPKPKQTLRRIADDFSAPEVDAGIWRVFTDGTGATVTEQGGELSVAIGADAQAGGPDGAVGGRVGTVCTFPDDFDARVDFTLFAWPPGGDVRAGLSALFADGFVGRRTTVDSGEEYTASVGQHAASVRLDETSGSLRIARVDGVMTTYYWRNGRWVSLASGRSSGAAVLGVGLTAGSDLAAQETRVAFDDFAVTAGNAFCPGG